MTIAASGRSGCATCAQKDTPDVASRGHLYVFEGGDACGKNTQATALHWRLNDARVSARPAVFFSFPRYDTPVGKAILRHLKGDTELCVNVDGTAAGFMTAPEDKLVFQCMMAADKYHAAAEIADYLSHGTDVICDRWWQSALVYGKSDGLDDKWLVDLHRFLPAADVVFLIDVPAHVAAARRPVARDRYEESMAKREEVRRLYLETWQTRQLSGWWSVIDGTPSVDVVSKEVWSLVSPHVARVD